MAYIDVFNGDADGICALVQLRNAEPRDSTLVTGVKRDVSLLSRVDAGNGDRICVLDISMDKNREDLERILKAGAQVLYIDHHFPGEIPSCERLDCLLSESPEVCSSILANSRLEGRFAGWAVVGAFGDNLKKPATAAAKALHLSPAQTQSLEHLGTYMNYNAYGAGIEDLYFAPEELYRLAAPYADPLQFLESEPETFKKLESGYHDDMAAAAAIAPERECAQSAVFFLPNQRWARRVSGVYSNQLANAAPDRGHAVLIEKSSGNYLVSVRAPVNNKVGADEICRSFAGGGRKGAAGINDLPSEQLGEFIEHFTKYYAQG